MSDKIEFLAYLPPIQSAIKVSGEGDTMRVQFEIALRISPEAFRIAMFTGKKLKVTVEEVEDKPEREPTQNDRRIKRNPLYSKETDL